MAFLIESFLYYGFDYILRKRKRTVNALLHDLLKILYVVVAMDKLKKITTYCVLTIDTYVRICYHLDVARHSGHKMSFNATKN